MSAKDADPSSEAFDALRAAHARMGALLASPRVGLIELAKAYQELALAMAEMARRSGRPSLRFDAIVRAMDLRTPKSALRAFVEGG